MPTRKPDLFSHFNTAISHALGSAPESADPARDAREAVHSLISIALDIARHAKIDPLGVLVTHVSLCGDDREEEAIRKIRLAYAAARTPDEPSN